MSESGMDAVMDLDLVDVDLLTPQMREMVRRMGLPDTMRLLEARGGRPLYVPKHEEADTGLRELVSPEGLRALSRWKGGETIDLPKPDKVTAQLRNQYIRACRRQGIKSGRQLAAELGVSYRWIKMVTSGSDPADETQSDLFRRS